MDSSSFCSSWCLLAFVLVMQALAADPNLGFSFKNFGEDSNFESQLALYGDAKVADDGMSVQLAGSGVSTAGRIIYKKPINVFEGNSRNTVSFSNYFVFSMSREYVEGLAFSMLPFGLPLNVFDSGSMGMLRDRKMKVLDIEFDTFRDEKYGDVSGKKVGFDGDSLVFVKVSNVSSMNFEVNGGEKLQAWIDYEASSRRFEVRLNKFLRNRPIDPVLSYTIDLSNMWKEGAVTVGLSSSSGNSSHKCYLYSWSFRTRTVPHWMHSKPMDPDSNFMEKGEELKVIPKRSVCASRVLAALIFGTGCGALGAFFVLFVCTALGNRRPVVPEAFAVQPKEFKSNKFNAPVGENIGDDQK
ncbi:putative L-type lectin-domain containing receptor kinase I.5 [Sesamum alatum]|uniref:L-type lectin-domain containing receptor kinase I.5 n=1 Tax=Sesamum alatum TaxID=300844 RepID=A0AAE2CSA1_9LAMI|nr:putative L-type lectin-domain containing receptor kinase I.5 [Sesamum alatum]